jgi:hypothetical protein
MPKTAGSKDDFEEEPEVVIAAHLPPGTTIYTEMATDEEAREDEENIPAEKRKRELIVGLMCGTPCVPREILEDELVHPEKPLLCQEICPNKSDYCGINPTQCPIALNGSIDTD